MRRNQFVEFLTTRYRGRAGRSLSAKGASDAASRLKRLESILDSAGTRATVPRSAASRSAQHTGSHRPGQPARLGSASHIARFVCGSLSRDEEFADAWNRLRGDPLGRRLNRLCVFCVGYRRLARLSRDDDRLCRYALAAALRILRGGKVADATTPSPPVRRPRGQRRGNNRRRVGLA